MATVPCGPPGFLAEASRLVVVVFGWLPGLGVEGVWCVYGEIQKWQREGCSCLYRSGGGKSKILGCPVVAPWSWEAILDDLFLIFIRVFFLWFRSNNKSLLF